MMRVPKRSDIWGGRCYWCDSLDDSEEDVFPKWIDKAFVLTSPCSGQPVQVAEPSGRPSQRIAGRRSRVRGSCKACNNGWMSQIENRLKSVLSPMVNGYATTLSPTDQIDVALWACLKSLAVDAHPVPGSRLASQGTKDAVCKRGSPPSSMKVRLGAISTPSFVRDHLPFARGNYAKADAWLSTFVLGFVVIWVLASEVPGDHVPLDPEVDQFDGMFTIWPPRQFDLAYPPPYVLRPSDVVDVTIGTLREVMPAPLRWSKDEMWRSSPVTCKNCGMQHLYRYDLPIPEGGTPSVIDLVDGSRTT